MSRPMWVGLAGVAVLCGVAAWWIVLPVPVVGPASTPATPAPAPVAHRAAPPAPAPPPLALPPEEPLAPPPLVGANGQPLPPGTVRPAPGLPERPPPRAPLDDPDAWSEVRTSAALRWREETLAAARAHGASAGWTDAERDAALAILTDLHDTLAGIRVHIEVGRTTPADGRAEMARAKADARARLVDALGGERTAALGAALDEVSGGGF